jgi:hypothetical protein
VPRPALAPQCFLFGSVPTIVSEGPPQKVRPQPIPAKSLELDNKLA